MTVIGIVSLAGCDAGGLISALVHQHHFTPVCIRPTATGNAAASLATASAEDNESLQTDQYVVDQVVENFSDVSLTEKCPSTLFFSSVEEAVDQLTSRWLENFVVCNLCSIEDYESFLRRPFFVLVGIQQPLMQRLAFLKQQTSSSWSLEQLAMDDDQRRFKFGFNDLFARAKTIFTNTEWTMDSLSNYSTSDGASVKITTELSTSTWIKATMQLDPTNPRWSRPSWDSYFISLTTLCSLRSNCMKRRVGAVIVGPDLRVVSTGYNGTAKGLVNCADGGCPRCNGNARCGIDLQHCYCLHAEENAIMEAGRLRCIGATLYSSTAPCLGCSQKIVQCGITRIVYALEYSSAHDTKGYLAKAGVQLEQYQPDLPSIIHL